METKPETALSISRDELKALVQEAVRAALLDMKSDLKPLVREAVRELLQESNGETMVKKNLSLTQFEALLIETSEHYKAVWKALS